MRSKRSGRQNSPASDWYRDTVKEYLQPSKYIDSDHPAVVAMAEELAHGFTDQREIARSCFEFVRDQIKHSFDYQLNPVTCRASDVLHHQTGYCYAKSHLLAALLRANRIPAGLCYQRLTIENDQPPFCLHGLNAVHLDDHGWYRIDARGNKTGITAEFTPPVEKLAFPIVIDGEVDFHEIWPAPLASVVELLESSTDYQQVAENLPDIEVITALH